MAHLSNKWISTTLLIIWFYFVIVILLGHFLFFRLLSSFEIIIILSIPYIFLSVYLLRYVILQYSCLYIRNMKKIEGEFDYVPSKSPDFWHKKMHYLRIIELLTLRESRIVYYRSCSGKIGDNVISDGYFSDPDLIEIGDNSIIGTEALIVSHSIEGKKIEISKVRIGKNCTIGSRSVIMPGCDIGDNVIIGTNSLVLKNTKISQNSVWVGIPARELKKNKSN